MRRLALTLVVLCATLATPATALAFQPPAILSAGVNAADQLYVTWTLGPGTTYDQAQFATAPALEPGAPYMFDLDNALGYECGDAEDCPSTPALTSYTTTSPVPRDRRYFAMVSAEAGTEHLASAVWVIDETKPVIGGPLPDIGDLLTGVTAGAPTAGLPLPASVIALLNPGAVLSQALGTSISLAKLPGTIGAVLRRGIRVAAKCGGPCVADAQLLLNGRRLARRSLSPRSAGAFTFTLRPAGLERKRLRSRRRARLQVVVTVTPEGGAPKRLTKSFAVRR